MTRCDIADAIETLLAEYHRQYACDRDRLHGWEAHLYTDADREAFEREHAAIRAAIPFIEAAFLPPSAAGAGADGRSLDAVPVYEVRDADSNVLGYTLDRDPGTADAREGRWHAELTGDMEPVSGLWLLGFRTLGEAEAYGRGVAAHGRDDAGYVTKQLRPGLAVCLIEWRDAPPEFLVEDLRGELPDGRAA